MIFSSSIYLPANFMTCLCLIAEYYSIVQMNHIFCIHSLVARHLGCFQFLAFTNKAGMNIVEQVPCLVSVGEVVPSPAVPLCARRGCRVGV